MVRSVSRHTRLAVQHCGEISRMLRYRVPVIRAATPADVPDLLRLIHALAAYEREPDAVQTTEADLHRSLFPQTDAPAVFADVATVNDQVVGLAIWFRTFSTWTGTHGIHLEDLFVDPEHRGGGHGRALLARLAQHCVQAGYRRLEWAVLDWNEPAIGFYRALGATSQDEWTTFRLTGDALQRLGSVSSS